MASDVDTVRVPQTIDVAILLRNPLDSDTLASKIETERQFHVVGSESLLDRFMRLCKRVMPTVAIIDASYPVRDGDVFAAAVWLLQDECVQRILFLDSAPNRTKALQALNVPDAGYFTRQRTFRQLVMALLDLVDGHTPLDGFDSESLRTARSTDHARYSPNSVLAKLTARELDVLQLIAEGRSVIHCARILRLSASTVDNHKTALMRKLGVRKASQLTLIAVREALIVP